jgi:hypothetical protein
MLGGAISQKEEFMLQSVNQNSLHLRLNELEQEKAILTKDLQAYIFK